jgi:hypothetical protein
MLRILNTGKNASLMLQAFAAEILNWDREQERKQKGGAAAAEECQDGLLIGDDPECQIIEKNVDLSSSHSLLAQDFTRHALAVGSARPLCDKRQNAANTLVAELLQAVESKTKAMRETEGEPRLLSYVHYLWVLNVREEVLRRGILEQVAHSGLQMMSEYTRHVVQNAKELLAQEAVQAVLDDSQRWHRAYHNFR